MFSRKIIVYNNVMAFKRRISINVSYRQIWQDHFQLNKIQIKLLKILLNGKKTLVLCYSIVN